MGPTGVRPDLVRRTGLKSQAVQSLVMAGAFDGGDAQPQEGPVGRRPRHPSCEERQRAFAVTGDGGAPAFADFTDEEKMMGEYRVMSIYPKGMSWSSCAHDSVRRCCPAAASRQRRKGTRFW